MRPRADYRCPECSHITEAQPCEEPTCDVCGIPMERIWTAPAPIFKGPGFYTTDSRDAK